MSRVETVATAPEQASERERILVPVLAAATFFAVLNTTMVNVILPTIKTAFEVSAAQAGWLSTLYSLVFGIATPFYGRLGDRYGIRRMYVIGMVIFVTSSILAAFTPPIFWLLVAFRVGQGLGSAAIPSLGQALITRTVPGIRRGAAIGMMMAAVGTGQAVGPPLSGTLTELISWRAVFLVSALAIVVLPFLVRLVGNETSGDNEPMDWVGGIMIGVAIAGFLIGLGSIEQRGLTSPVVAGSFTISLVALAFTILRQRFASFPFIDRELLRNNRYLILCGLGFLMMGASVSVIVITPFMLDDVNGLSAAEIGLVLLPQAVVVTLLSRRMGRLADRYDALNLATVGATINLIVIGTLAFIAIGWSAIAIGLLLGVFGIGQATTFPALGATTTRSIPERLAGTAMGLYNMLFFVGSAFGVATSTLMLSEREDADLAILPFYAGDETYSQFSDAFLYGLAAMIIAIILIQLARRTVPHTDEQPGRVMSTKPV